MIRIITPMMNRLASPAFKLTSRSLSSQTEGFKKVGVVGLGLMGHGVAQVAAQSGYQVIGIESKQDALDVGMKRIEDSLGKVVARNIKKNVYDESAGKAAYDEVMGRISCSTDLNDLKDCDLIVEAIIENMDIKLDFYQKLGGIINKDCVFASNTSSLQITAMAEISGRADKFVGLHFFNPVQIMKLVEVIRTEHTDDATFNRMLEFGKNIDKTTVSCQDTPGFIVNRLLVPYLCQALAMVDRKEASVADIDVSMQLGAGHPMGPLHLADYVGLDTIKSIMDGWQKDHPNEPAFIMPKILEEKVKNGDFGRKSGKGFYVWDGEKRLGPV
jgi:3-hydroxyacyl-CoA dehydrogenase